MFCAREGVENYDCSSIMTNKGFHLRVPRANYLISTVTLQVFTAELQRDAALVRFHSEGQLLVRRIQVSCLPPHLR